MYSPPNFINYQFIANLISSLPHLHSLLMYSFEANPKHHIISPINILVYISKNFFMKRNKPKFYHT